MDLKSVLAAQSYSATRPATEPFGHGIGAGASKAFAEFSAILEQGETTAMAALQSEASPHALVQALTASEFAVDATVTIRDKVVEAYQEILRMPV